MVAFGLSVASSQRSVQEIVKKAYELSGGNPYKGKGGWFDSFHTYYLKKDKNVTLYLTNIKKYVIIVYVS